MARILGLGVATLDIINTVDQYPAEDAKIRSQICKLGRGGNAANSLVVLSQLGHQCSFAGVISSAPDTGLIQDDFNKYHIDTSNCPIADQGSTPTSYITLSRETGSRTIVHNRDLRELCFDDFVKIKLSDFDWLHFEGREVEETKKMLAHVKQMHPQIPVSLEVEKPRDNIQQLFAFPDILFFSQSYAMSLGFKHAEEFITSMKQNPDSNLFDNKELICTWGNKDTVALNKEGQLFHSATFPPATVIDTIAAGDTFNAGFIDAWLTSTSMEQALASANKLAGHKCGQSGLDNLVTQHGLSP